MSSTRLIYDDCATDLRTKTSVGELLYHLSPYSVESCNRCGGALKEVPLATLADWESELKGITRVQTLCPEKKYLPNCPYTKSGPYKCINTFDKHVPNIINPEVCKFFYVFNNLRPMTNPGFTLPCPNPCK